MSYFQSFDNKNIYYKIINQNRNFTLFFLHGWSSNHTYYEGLKKYLSNFNIILWDARTHGQSDIVRYTKINDMAKDLYFFLQHINQIKTPIIPIGHSMGALIIFEYIKNYNCSNFYKIVLVDQSPKLITDNEWKMGIYGNFPESLNEEYIKYFREDIGYGLIKLSIEGLNTQYKKIFEKNPEFFYSQKRVFSKEQNEALVDIWEDLVQKDYRDILDKIDIPVLLIFGEKSQYYVPEVGNYLKNRIANSKLYIIKNGDHSPFNANSHEFCQLITNFVLN